jgi:hypothetical protein
LNFYCVTCASSRYIVPAQKLLFRKYLNIEPTYIDVDDTPLKQWGPTVASMLPDDEFIVFGLDDFLPIGHIDWDGFNKAAGIVANQVERFELGWGASVGKSGLQETNGWLRYTQTTSYKVSTQFSIWRTTALARELERTTTPWDFEIRGRCTAGCFNKEDAVFRFIDSSAISGRRPGKLNLCGLRQEDEDELVRLGLVDKSKVIYGWLGDERRTKEAYGDRYAEFF